MNIWKYQGPKEITGYMFIDWLSESFSKNDHIKRHSLYTTGTLRWNYNQLQTPRWKGGWGMMVYAPTLRTLGFWRNGVSNFYIILAASYNIQNNNICYEVPSPHKILTPKSSIDIGFSMKYTIHFGVPPFNLWKPAPSNRPHPFSASRHKAEAADRPRRAAPPELSHRASRAIDDEPPSSYPSTAKSKHKQQPFREKHRPICCGLNMA